MCIGMLSEIPIAVSCPWYGRVMPLAWPWRAPGMAVSCPWECTPRVHPFCLPLGYDLSCTSGHCTLYCSDQRGQGHGRHGFEARAQVQNKGTPEPHLCHSPVNSFLMTGQCSLSLARAHAHICRWSYLVALPELLHLRLQSYSGSGHNEE